MARVTIASLQETIERLQAERARAVEDRVEYFDRMTNAELRGDRLEKENGKLKERIAELERLLSAQAPAPTPIPSNPKRGRPFRITEETKAQVRSLREQGCSMRTIARAVGLSVSTVHSIITGT